MLFVPSVQNLRRDQPLPAPLRCEDAPSREPDGDVAQDMAPRTPRGQPPDDHRGAIVVAGLWLLFYLLALADRLLSGWT